MGGTDQEKPEVQLRACQQRSAVNGTSRATGKEMNPSPMAGGWCAITPVVPAVAERTPREDKESRPSLDQGSNGKKSVGEEGERTRAVSTGRTRIWERKAIAM